MLSKQIYHDVRYTSEGQGLMSFSVDAEAFYDFI